MAQIFHGVLLTVSKAAVGIDESTLVKGEAMSDFKTWSSTQFRKNQARSSIKIIIQKVNQSLKRPSISCMKWKTLM